MQCIYYAAVHHIFVYSALASASALIPRAPLKFMLVSSTCTALFHPDIFDRYRY